MPDDNQTTQPNATDPLATANPAPIVSDSVTPPISPTSIIPEVPGIKTETSTEPLPSFINMDSSIPTPPSEKPEETPPSVKPVVEEQSEMPEETPPIIQDGSSAPSFDIPPVVTPPEKPKAKLGGKVIATILGILLLVGGIGVGLYLVGQQQDIRKRAGCAPNCDCSDVSPWFTTIRSGFYCDEYTDTWHAVGGTTTTTTTKTTEPDKCGTGIKEGDYACQDQATVVQCLSTGLFSPPVKYCGAGLQCQNGSLNCVSCTSGTCNFANSGKIVPGTETQTTTGATGNTNPGGICPTGYEAYYSSQECASTNGTFSAITDTTKVATYLGCCKIPSTSGLPFCPNSDCNIPPSQGVECILNAGATKPMYCCPANKPLYYEPDGNNIDPVTGMIKGECVAGTPVTPGGGTHTSGSQTIDCTQYVDATSGIALSYPTEAVAKACCPPQYYTNYGKWYCGTESNGGDTTTPICQNIKAYDTSWNALTADQLKTLKVGDVVKFTVKGANGTFDKAQFKINGAATWTERTDKKPSTEEFFIDYTIPEGITSFAVEAQVHVTGGVWK